MNLVLKLGLISIFLFLGCKKEDVAPEDEAPKYPIINEYTYTYKGRWHYFYRNIPPLGGVIYDTLMYNYIVKVKHIRSEKIDTVIVYNLYKVTNPLIIKFDSNESVIKSSGVTLSNKLKNLDYYAGNTGVSSSYGHQYQGERQ